MSKKIISSLSCIASILLMNIVCFAFSGWNLVDGEFMYLNDEGKAYLNMWQESNGEMYYLGDEGYIVRNRMFEYSGEYYYVDEWGRRIRNDYVIINDKTNTNEEFAEGVYYFDDKGHAVRRRGNKFVKNINGVYQAFDEQGKILVGWLDKEGYLLNDENIMEEGCYYANGDGILMRNTWYKFSDDIGFYSNYIEKSQQATDRYIDMDCLWIYFDKNCKKVASSDGELLSKTLNGRMYAFDEYGVMMQGFTKNKALDLSQASNPKIIENVKYYDKVDGDYKKGAWINTVPSQDMSQTDNSDDTASWFRVGVNGGLIKNALRTVDGIKYAFDGIGRMKTGFVQMSESEFIADFKSEDLTKEDFIFHISEGGKLFGSDLCELYYFGKPLDEGGTGAIVKGTVDIPLRDGIYQFKFKNSTGEAYGVHTVLQKSGDAYYINGLKLCAWDDEKYGIVKVSDTEYVVVNSSGKIIKGNKKLIKDEHDNYIIIMGNRLVAYIENPGDNIKIKWRNSREGVEEGYYFYNKEKEVRAYVGMAARIDTPCPNSSQLANIPKEMRVNYK